MKTTIELADPLLIAAKTLAAEEHTTLRALVEEGLRIVMQQRKTRPSQRFNLRDERFNGQQTVWPDAKQWHDIESQDLANQMQLNRAPS